MSAVSSDFELEQLLRELEREPAFLKRIPGLAFPFAVVGASAAVFTMFALGFSFQPDASSLVVAFLTGAFMGALVGATLRRWKRLHDPMLTREGLKARIALVVIPAGAVVGAAIGYEMFGKSGLQIQGAVGVVAAVAFLPSCFSIVGAAQRAARARLGSLVAMTDRRTTRVSLLAVVSFAGLLSTPALATIDTTIFSWVLALRIGLSLGLCGAATVGIAWMWRCDRVARLKLEAIAEEMRWLDRGLDVLEGDSDDDSDGPSTLDLGLGDEQWSRGQVATYRTMGMGDARLSPVLFRGSINDAMKAFSDAFAQRRRALLLSWAALAATGVSLSVSAMHLECFAAFL